MKKSSIANKLKPAQPVALRSPKPRSKPRRSAATPATVYASFGCGQKNALITTQSMNFPARPANTTYFVIDYVSAWMSFPAAETMNPIFDLTYQIAWIDGSGTNISFNGDHYFLAQPSYSESGGSMFVVSQAVKIAVDASGGVTLNTLNISNSVEQYSFVISGHYE
jgi:hypothetical protein